MSNEELPNIVEGIFREELPENERDVADADDFCNMIADWISKLDTLANDERLTAARSRSIVANATNGDAISEIISDGLHDDVDSDQISLYIEALGELKEMAEELHAAFPRTYAKPVAETSMSY